MKKKVWIAALIVVVILALIVVCALIISGRPKYAMSKQHEKYGKKALEIVDAYLDYDLTADEAYDRMKSLCDSKKTLPPDAEEEEFGNLMVTSEVSLLYFSIGDLKYNRSGASSLLERRNNLAETLGCSTR